MTGLDEENLVSLGCINEPSISSSFYTSPGNTNLTFIDLENYYHKLHHALVHTPSVDGGEVALLEKLVNTNTTPPLYRAEARTKVAFLLYRQGRRSEARATLRSLDLELSNNMGDAICLKVKAALIMAAAGDVQSAFNMISKLKRATEGLPVQSKLAEALPFFETLTRRTLQN